jgi:hypothetical protein
MADSIDTKMMTVTVQENGIIRTTDGLLIARLNDDIRYDDLDDEITSEEGNTSDKNCKHENTSIMGTYEQCDDCGATSRGYGWDSED